MDAVPGSGGGDRAGALIAYPSRGRCSSRSACATRVRWAGVKLRLLPPLLVVTALLAGCGGGGPARPAAGTTHAAKPAPGEIAVVGARPVTLAMYERGLAEVRAELTESGSTVPGAGTSAYRAMRTSVIDALVHEAELRIEAEKLGISVEPAEVAARIEAIKRQHFAGSEAKFEQALEQQGVTEADLRESLLDSLLQDKLELALTRSIRATPAQVAAYYARNVAHYTKPATRKVREILVGKSKEALARRIYDELRSGASFAALARRYSQDSSSRDTGGLFTATKGRDVPEFDQAVFAAGSKTGRLLAPVETAAYGWFVIQPLAPIAPATTTPESKVAPAIRKALDASEKQKALTAWAKKVTTSFCAAGRITYEAGYAPSPDPCASAAAPKATTTS